MKKNAMFAAVVGVAMFALTGCGGSSEPAAPSASTSASATPSSTPSQAKAISTPKQLASAIYTSRQGFLKAAKDWDTNYCDRVLTAGKKGIDLATCTSDLFVLQTSAKTIVLQLDSNKSWPEEVSTLADSTYSYVNQVAAVGDTTDFSSSHMGIVNLAVKLAVMKLESWAPYMGS